MKDCELRDSHDSAARASRPFQFGRELPFWIWGLVEAARPFGLKTQFLIDLVAPAVGKRNYARIKPAIDKLLDRGILVRHGEVIKLNQEGKA